MKFARRLSLSAMAVIACICLPGSLSPGAAQWAALTYDQEDAVTAFIWARYFEKRCPAWRLSEILRARAFDRLEIKTEDFVKGGKFAARFEQYEKNARGQLTQIKIARLCEGPKRLFGPKGSWLPGWMIER